MKSSHVNVEHASIIGWVICLACSIPVWLSIMQTHFFAARTMRMGNIYENAIDHRLLLEHSLIVSCHLFCCCCDYILREHTIQYVRDWAHFKSVIFCVCARFAPLFLDAMTNGTIRTPNAVSYVINNTYWKCRFRIRKPKRIFEIFPCLSGASSDHSPDVNWIILCKC